MTYQELRKTLDNYNWDDGFEIPQKILEDENCDLAMALEIFYMGDGYTYLQTYAHNIGGTKEWFRFIHKLYEDIEHGRYEDRGRHYQVPFSKAVKYRLRRSNVPEIFLEDL